MITPCHIKLSYKSQKITSKQLTRQVITPDNTLVAQFHIPLLLAWHKRPMRSKASRFSGLHILSYRHLVEITGRDIRSLQSLYLHSQHKHTSHADTQSRTSVRDYAPEATAEVTLLRDISRNVHRQTKFKQKHQSPVITIHDISLNFSINYSAEWPRYVIRIP